MSLSDDDIATLELAAETARADITEYAAPRGTPTWDDVRVGRMLAREPVFARLVPIALAELHAHRTAGPFREALIPSARLVELLERATSSSGAVAKALSASEWHELRDEVKELASTIKPTPGKDAP